MGIVCRQVRPRAVILPSLILLTLVLVVLATVLVETGTSSLRASTKEQSANQALYAAEAGIAAAVEEYDRLTKLEGDERTGKLSESGASYRVVILRNEDIGARRVYHDLLPADGLELPASTLYLLSVGRSENGTMRRAGALFRTGLEAIEVGVLSDRLVAKNSEFRAYDSASTLDPGATSQSESGLLASHRVDPYDETPEFELLDTQVEGGVYVAPHSTPTKGIHKSGNSKVTREGVLGGPIVLEDIVVPKGTSGNGESGAEGAEADTSGGGRLDPKDARGGNFRLGELVVKWSGFPVKVTFFEDDGDEIGMIPLSALQNKINNSVTASRNEKLVSNGDDEAVFWSSEGEFLFVDDGDIEGRGPVTGELLELLSLTGTGVTDVENPEVLGAGKEYGTVTITDTTPTLLEDGVIVIENLEISAGGKLQLPEGRKATIYVTGRLKVEGDNALLNSTKLPPNLKVFYTGVEPVKLSGGAQAYFTLIAPEADVLLQGEQADFRTKFYGALVGKTVGVENADFYFDVATKGIGTGAQGSSLRLLNRHRL